MGRPPYPRDEHGNIIRPGDPGNGRNADSGGGLATAERELSDLGQRVKRGAGGRFVTRGADSAADSGHDIASADTGPEAPAEDQQKEPRVSRRRRKEEASTEPVTVEPAPSKVKTPRAPSGKISAKGAFKAEHVTRTTEALFGLAAMMLQRPHWAVQNPKMEVDPWAPSAAELLNKYIPDMETADKFTDGMAAMSVILGIGGMVAMRYRQDQAIAHQQRMRQAQARRQEMIDQEHRIDPEQGATGQSDATAGHSRNGHVPGTGAAPTQPGRIDGLGGSMF